MICPVCGGEGKIGVPYSSVWGSGRGMSNEEAERRAGDIHHYKKCERCGGTGNLLRYLFIQSGIGSCAEEAYDNCDFEAEVECVDLTKYVDGEGIELLAYKGADSIGDICIKATDILKNEMEE